MTARHADVIREAMGCGRSGCTCARRTGNVHCPSHEDRNPSLSVDERPDGRPLLYCHAGCEQSEVIAALRERGLWPAQGEDDAERTSTSPSPTSRRSYELRDVDGRHVATHVREERADGSKSFTWRRPDGRSGLDGTLTSALPLYGAERLPCLPGAAVVVVEGEKAAEALLARDVLALGTVTGASGAPADDPLRALLGRRVLLWPDADEPGRKHMQRIAGRLRVLGHADVELVEWRDAPTGGDAADFVGDDAALHSLLDSAARTEDIAILGVDDAGTAGTPDGVALTWRTGEEISRMVPERPEWIAEPFVAAGAITECSAKIKAGKTTFTLALIGAVVRGERFLGWPTRRTPVVILTEERPATFRAAMARAGLLGSTDVHVLFRSDAQGLSWPAVVDAARAKTDEVGALLLTIDTLGDWASIAGDEENSSGTALEAMRPVQAAAAAGLAVMVVRHDRKSGGELGDSARGSSAFGGAADVLMSLRRPDGQGHPQRRVLHAVGRFDGIPPQLVIEWREGVYVALGETMDLERQTARARLLDLLPAQEPGLMEAEIVERIGKVVSRSTVRRVMDDMLRAGEIAKHEGLGKTGRAFGYVLGNQVSAHRSEAGQSIESHDSGESCSTNRVPNPEEAEQSIEPVSELSRNDVSSPRSVDGQSIATRPAIVAYEL